MVRDLQNNLKTPTVALQQPFVWTLSHEMAARATERQARIRL